MAKYTREDCVNLLCRAQRAREEQGMKGYVCRSDFSTDEVVAIKAFLGPWPRALEAAGIKPPKLVSQKDLNRQRRIRAKRKRRLAASDPKKSTEEQ